ncbi:MAG: mucoidy inhibitor MuiA family protein [Candidatus Thorarchaeota archaeon]|nr:mucoidy inhibitor MuiA family protein [Candidatus Thorarchaeota archaeon]
MVKLDTTIRRVTLLRNGARVTRVGKISLPAGSQTIIVKEITQFAETDSFRISGKGPAVLTSIDVEQDRVILEPDPKVNPLKKKLESLQKKKKELEDEIDLLKVKMGGIETTVDEFITTVGTTLSAGDGSHQLVEFYDTSDNAYAVLQEQLRTHEEELEDLNTEIETVKQNLEELMDEDKSISVYNVSIQLTMKEQAEVEIALEYQVYNASWEPTYDIDLSEKQAHIKRLAMVSNQTMEDWEDIQLIISTASTAPVEVIQPSPLIVSEEVSTRGEERDKTSGGRIGYSGAFAPVAMETGRETYAGVAIYELPQKFTIPSDIREHPVLLVEEDMDSKTLHYWYADEMPEVVARNEITNGDLVLLEGRARVFRKGEYIGESYIPMVAPRETMKLGTRAAHDVRAEKKMLKREVEKAGITRGKARREYQYELKIENFSDDEIEIEIVDRIPHSTAGEIEVKLEKEDELGLEEFRLGIMRWKKKIAPKQKKIITYEFEVVWKRDITIEPPLP